MIVDGDTAWTLICCALVLLMTPGLAFFYSGLVPERNAINTIKMSFICLAFIPVIWSLLGYSLAFAAGNGFIGGIEFIGLRNISDETLVGQTIPEYAFMAFQMMFAVIAPAIISGAVVGRMRFRPYIIFICLWSLFIYSPIAHWVWGPDGWLADDGAIDFAGGTVVHISAGFSALAAAAVLGPRDKLNSDDNDEPHNVPLVILGASLLWFGWFGFNAGSSLAANKLAALAFLNTALATSSAIVVWTLLGWIHRQRSASVGSAIAAVVGLVAITPAAGYVKPLDSLYIGGIAAVISYYALLLKSRRLQKEHPIIDDTLDVFACHGLAGVSGCILTGVFASKSVNSAGANGLLYGNPHLVLIQLIAVGATIVMALVGTAIILLIIRLFMRLRPSKAEMIVGIDILEHGESAYTVSREKIMSN